MYHKKSPRFGQESPLDIRLISAFSFLEVLIVIAILAILQAFFLPQLLQAIKPPDLPVIEYVEIEVPVEIPCKLKDGHDNGGGND